MFANHPEMAKQWAAETPSQSDLPEHKGGSVKPHMKAKKMNPKLDAISDLHKMLSGAIAEHLKAKQSAKLSRDPAEADAPETELSEEGEAADESDPRTLRKKKQFGGKK